MNAQEAVNMLRTELKYFHNIIDDIRPEHGGQRRGEGTRTVTQQVRHVAQTARWLREGAFGTAVTWPPSCACWALCRKWFMASEAVELTAQALCYLGADGPVSVIGTCPPPCLGGYGYLAASAYECERESSTGSSSRA